MLDAREPTQKKALNVHLYSGIDLSQGFFNVTGSQLQCTNPEEMRLPQSQLKKRKSPLQHLYESSAFEPAAEPSVGLIILQGSWWPRQLKPELCKSYRWAATHMQTTPSSEPTTAHAHDTRIAVSAPNSNCLGS